MSRPRRVLLTARAACAAWGMVEIWRVLRERPDLELRLLAQQPALGILRAEGLPCVAVELPPATDSAGELAARLLDLATAALADFEPEAVLAGLSTPGEGGIDEAVVQQARCPSFVVQDFGGDCNRFFGRQAHCYLAPDEASAELTRGRHGALAATVGSPRHARYAGLDVVALRRATLLDHGLDPDDCFPGLFTQPLFDCPGYLVTLAAWAEAVAGLRPGGAVVYRSHPACTVEQARAVAALLARLGLRPVTLSGGAVEGALAACGVPSSALSNVNLDAAYLNRYAAVPLTVPFYLLWDETLSARLGGFQDLDAIPLVAAGLALSVRRRSDLPERLREALDPEVRATVWRRAAALPDPRDAIAAVVEACTRPERFLATTATPRPPS